MTIKSLSDSQLASARRAEAARRALETKPKPEVRPTKQAGTVADGFSDTKLDEMADIAKGISQGPKKAKEDSMGISSGFDMPKVSSDGAVIGGNVSGKLDIGALSVSLKAKASVSLGSKDGVTTAKVTGEVSATVAFDGKLGPVGAKASISEGKTASYTVAMPDEWAAKVDVTSVNPFIPSSMPTGTVVTMDESSFKDTKMGASFKALSVEAGIKESEGTSIAIEKTGDTTVRVTVGPTEGIDATFRVGLGLGKASVGVGRSDELDGRTMRTAEFDVSTPEGAKAYAAFVEQGVMPDKDGPGVKGVATIETTTVSSATSVDLKLGDSTLSHELARNEGKVTRTTLPDGTSTESARLAYGSNVPLELTRAYDAAGKEILSERRYSFEVKVDEQNAETLSAALGEGAKVEPGKTVTVSFTEEEMQTYLEHTRTTAAVGELRDEFDELLIGVETPLEFAVAIARRSNDFTFGATMYGVADGADGRYDGGVTSIPATLTEK